MKDKLGYEWWEEILKAQRVISGKFPESVLVGGTAAALHCGHRVSMDADSVLCDLKPRFSIVLRELERQAGWVTNRIKPPVLILGNLYGIETGIRQLIRQKPLETTTVNGIKIPTLAEMARIKAWLIVRRNATRDYLDFCALADKLGDKLIKALEPIDELYPQKSGETVTRQLVKQLAEPNPHDLSEVNLAEYKGTKPPYNDWGYIEKQCKKTAEKIAQDLMLAEKKKPHDSPTH